jgi:hypothetical protein
MVENGAEIIFKIRVQTKPGEVVHLTGNVAELGNWDPVKGIALSTEEQFYPFWVTKQPVQFPMGQEFEFKIVVLSETKEVIRWEELPSNRIYKPIYPRVSIEGEEGNPSGRECILKKNVNGKEPLDVEIRVQRFQIKGFDPYLKADISDTDSDSRSVGLFSAASIDGEFMAKINVPGPQFNTAKKLSPSPGTPQLTSPGQPATSEVRHVPTEERKLDAILGGGEDGFDEFVEDDVRDADNIEEAPVKESGNEQAGGRVGRGRAGEPCQFMMESNPAKQPGLTVIKEVSELS